MTVKEVLAYLEVSRATLYRLMQAGVLAPLPKHNPLHKRETLRFLTAAVLPLRPDKQPPT